MTLIEDGLARAVHYPKVNGADDVFEFGSLLRLDEFDGRHVMSVVSIALAGHTEAVHAYGCRTALTKNKAFEERKGRPPAPWPSKPLEKVYYLGFYQFSTARVLEIPISYHAIAVVPVEEDGNKEHCEVQLSRRTDVDSTDKQRKQERLEFKDDLRDLLFGPHWWICGDDIDIADDLVAVPLPKMPTEPASAS